MKDLAYYHEVIRSDLYEQGPVVACIRKDTPDYEIISISPNIKRLYGYDVREMEEGKIRVETLIHPDDLERFRNEQRRSWEERPESYEYSPFRFRMQDGHYRWVINATNRLEGTDHLISYLTDITSEKETLIKIQQSQKALASAQKIAKIGSWRLDMRDNSLEWSDEIYRIFELDREHFTPSYEGFLSVIHPDDAETVGRVFRESVEEKAPYAITHRLLMPDGRVKYVIENGNTTYDVDGTPIISEGTVQDITQLKELEIAYASEHRFVTTMIDNAESIIAAIDKDGTMVELNRYGCEFTGYSPEEVASEPYF